MSERTREFFEHLKHDVKESVASFWPDIMAEGKRLAIQGAAELANALFNGHAYLPYGRGQTPAKLEPNIGEHQPSVEHRKEEPGKEQERSGMSM